MKKIIKLSVVPFILLPAFQVSCSENNVELSANEKEKLVIGKTMTIKRADIKRFSDGDTFYLNETYINPTDKQTENRGVRIHGVDTPENDYSGAGETLQKRYADRAKAGLMAIIGDKDIEIQITALDQYYRWIARWYVYDGTTKIDVAAEMIKEGFGVIRYLSSHDDPTYYSQMKAWETEARDNYRCVWELQDDMSRIYRNYEWSPY